METVPQIVHRPRSFLSTLALGVSALGISLVVCATAVTCYSLYLFDQKTSDVFELAAEAARGLPHLRAALPPVLADALSDAREPAYAAVLKVNVKAAPVPERGGFRPVIEVENGGEETVTLLAMRIVALNDRGEPVGSWHEYGATPFTTADSSWRGPLLPGSRRYFDARGGRSGIGIEADAVELKVEITDVRVWRQEPGRRGEEPKGRGGQF
jgi:hypothetical protein